MTKKLAAASSFFILAALVSVGIWIGKDSFVQGQSQTEANDNLTEANDNLNVFTRINAKARKAKNGDYASVEQLTDVVFDSFDTGMLPASIKQEFKTRVIQSELAYRQGRKQGIPEKNLVDAINEIANQINAPEYTKTRVGEVRRLRVGVLPYMPELVSNRMANATSSVGSAIVKPMSPLEAVYFMLLLIEQKRYSPDFQLTLQEWEIKEKEKKAKNKGKPKKEPKSDKVEVKAKNKTQRQQEVEAAINSAGVNKSSTELLNAARKSLDTLGVD